MEISYLAPAQINHFSDTAWVFKAKNSVAAVNGTLQKKRHRQPSKTTKNDAPVDTGQGKASTPLQGFLPRHFL